MKPDDLVSAPIELRLSRAAELRPEGEALVVRGDRFTYARLDSWHRAIAAFLLDSSIKLGDSVLWQLPNLPEALVIHAAILRAGCVSIPLPMLYRRHELNQIISDSRPSAVFAIDGYRQRDAVSEVEQALSDARHDPRLRGCLGNAPAGWTSFPAEPSSSENSENVDDLANRSRFGPDEPVLILYTSGTTAEPKGVIHTRRSLENVTAMLHSWCRFDGESCFITAAPVAHIAGLLAMSFLPLTCAGKAVLMDGWDPEEAVELVAAERATFSCGASVFLNELVETYETLESDRGFHRLSTFICGGSAIPPDLIVRAAKEGVSAFRSWGMTEAPMIGMSHSSDPLEIRAGTDGRVCPGGEVEAVDDERRPLPVGEIGELRVRAPQMMLGYTSNSMNRTHLDGSGWLYTGDVGFVDATGCVTMTGRTKDIINRGGEKFSAQDVENALATHPAITVAAIVAVSDPRFGEEAACFIQLRQGAEWPGDQSFIRHLEAAGLARQKIPKYWSLIEEMPRTSAGKIRKDVLRSLSDQSLVITTD
ncbi:MAG: AMP-binding protein [Acidimicrobiales bacterium]